MNEETTSMRLIERNQLVGLGNGFSVLRDLYETREGKRVSVQKTRVMFAQCRADREKQKWVFLNESELQSTALP